MNNNNKKKKVMFVISSLVGGGAEKVLIDIINHLSVDKYDIHLVLFEKKGVYCSRLPVHLKVYDLKKKNRYSFFRLVFQLAGLFRKIRPNTVLSFMAYHNLITILAKFVSRYRGNVIISIHNYLSLDLLHVRCRRIKSFLYRNTFKYSDSVVVPSAGLEEDLVQRYKIDFGRIKMIYNPIILKTIDSLKDVKFERDGFEEYVLAVGRLTKQKDYPCLLKAYSLICQNIEEKLVILGDGEDQVQLKQLTRDLGIQNNVSFLGFQENPYKFMKNATLFVLSSLWEGFAIVVAEAMACGVPVISTDCQSGPGEIITNGENGILVPPADEKRLAEAMLTLIEDRNLREKFSKEGRKRAENFDIEKILPQYEELF